METVPLAYQRFRCNARHGTLRAPQALCLRTLIPHLELTDMFTANSGRRARKSAEAELRDLVSSSEELLKTLGDQTGDAATALRIKLSRNIASAKEQMSALSDALDSVTEEAVNETRSFVSRRPWTAAALGVALGVAIGTTLMAVNSARR